MPQFDRVFKARLGTGTAINTNTNHAIWVRGVKWRKEALIHISQTPNDIYLSPAETREYADYLIDLANKMDGNVRLTLTGDEGIAGSIDFKPDEGQR